MSSHREPSDEQAFQCLRIGAGTVDFATREIHMPEARAAARVTPKAIAVLRLLAQTPGAVLTRNELLAGVWPDTLPTDDVLTQAVTQLRKAFGAGSVSVADGRLYIETIAKTGYRLTVPVEVVETPETAPAASPRVTDPSFLAVDAPVEPGPLAAPAVGPTARSTVATRWLVGIAALAVLVAAGLGLLLAYDDESSTAVTSGVTPLTGPGRPYRLITNAAGFELSPTLSPDASMVAYSASPTAEDDRSSGSAILVQTTTSAAPRVLSRPGPRERDDLPAWSPDGYQIAFSRRGADGSCRVLLIAATGAGDEREVARCDGSELLSFDWLPDSSGLLFGTMTGTPQGDRLRVLNPVDGRWRELDYPSTPGDLDVSPKVSPDGRWIAFVRNPQMGDVWRMPAEGGTARQLTRLGAEMRGLAWAPDSRSLVFGIRVDHESRLYRLDTETGEFADLGIEDAQAPVIASRSGMLAFVHRRPHFGIRSVDATTGAATALFASTGRDTQPIVSPDGRQLAFTSDRAGRFELWWADLQRPMSLRPLSGVRPDTRQSPVWSHDSQRLLVSVLDGHGAPSVVEIEPASGHVTPVAIPAERPSQAVYGPDGRLLVIEEYGEGRTELVAYGQDDWRPLGRIEGVSQVRFDPANGRVLYTRLDSNGLWSSDADLSPGSVRQLSDRFPTRWRYRNWALAPGGRLAYLDGGAGCRSRLSLYDMVGDALQRDDVLCLSPENRSATNGFSLSRDHWLVSVASEDGTDLGFMPLPMASYEHEHIARWLFSLRKKAS